MNEHMVAAHGALVKEITTIRSALEGAYGTIEPNYTTANGALSTPFDSDVREKCKRIAGDIVSNPPSLVVLAGIGGSSVGTLAVLNALLERDAYGLLYSRHAVDQHQQKSAVFQEEGGMRFICADTIDDSLSLEYQALVETELKKNRRVLLIIITKSGTTSETIINGSLFLEVLKKYKPRYQEDVVIITEHGSPLEQVAVDEHFGLLSLPSTVGGRFSVFTAVGLFPLALMGIDIDQFCDGAKEMLSHCLRDDFAKNPAARSALMLADHYAKGYMIHDLFVFSPKLTMFVQWYKQLIGESLGKKFDRQGNVVEIGMTPTVSQGTTDLHSVAQLYLAGPRNRITTFLAYDSEPASISIPDNEVSAVLSGLVGSRVYDIKDAIFRGVCAAYEKEQRPFMIEPLVYKSASSLGACMMTKMVETLFLAAIWNIDPFDQPAVEIYKQETRAFLKKV